VRRIALLVCCGILLGATTAGSAVRPTALSTAAWKSGLTVHTHVRTSTESKSRFDAHVSALLRREYPAPLQSLDNTLYVGLGLQPAQSRIGPALLRTARAARVAYDPFARIVRERRSPKPARRELVQHLVWALAGQSYNVRRLALLRANNRDAFFAGDAVVDGLASLASGLRMPKLPQGPAITRFMRIEQSVGLSAGRAFMAHLRYVGGKRAVANVLRTPPKTTEQVLHVDKYLQHEAARPISLPAQIAYVDLKASETFGELDVQALLRAFSLRGAAVAAAGWGGGKIVLYTDASGNATVGVALRWDTPQDEAEWQSIAVQYVEKAFPNAVPRVCPAADHCWSDGTRELALASRGDLTTFGSGPAGELVAATLTH